ncbi:MAG: hypothetical protein AAGA48_27855 [Myxococcota bacterium]
MRVQWLGWICLIGLGGLGCEEAEEPEPLGEVAPPPQTFPNIDTGFVPDKSTALPTGNGGYDDCKFGTEVVCFCQSCDTKDRRGTFDRYLNSCLEKGDLRDFVLCYTDQVEPYGNGQYGIDCPSAWKSCRDLLP